MKLTKAFLLCACFFVLGLWKAGAQTIQVSGTVTSKTNNEALEGVTVSVKGTTVATVTDKSGNYTISAPQNSVLTFTYAGMTPEQVTVKSAGPVNVVLNPRTSVMDEIVVVGYGTQKKALVTGAISSVKAKDLEKVPNGTVETALQGRVSGVAIAANSGQPGARSTIRVRGVTTFGNNDPLWVVDGVIVDNGAIGYLNQSDIESMELLKDAASAAIYGTRAAAGVLLITTKKGRAGKLSFNYNGFWGTSSPAKKLDLLNASQYAALRNEKSVAGGGGIVFPDINKYGTGTDWQNEIFNDNAKRYNHDLSLSGGNDKSTFYLSFNLQDQEGIVSSKISHYNKKSFRLNSNHKISKFFTFGQTLGYTHQKALGIGNTNSEYGGPLSSAINLDPVTPVVETDPSLIAQTPYSNNGVLNHGIFTDGNGNPYAISSYVGQEMTNPKAYEHIFYGDYNWSDDVIGSAFIELNINKHIKFKTIGGAKLAFWGSRDFTPIFYLSATQNNTIKNSLTKVNQNTFNWNIENTLSYTNKFGYHDVTVVIGQGAYVDNNGGGSAVSIYDLPITDWQDASFNFDIPQSNRTSGSWDFVNHKISSLFGRVNYNYKERYLVTGIIRRDGSSRFGSNNKFATFPSFSIGWNVSKENFWPTNKYVNLFKLRLGSGKTGNDGNIPDFRYLSTVAGGYNYTIGSGSTVVTGYSPVTLDNPDLKWEETTQTNVGFDAQVLSDFNISFDVYNKKTKGILRPVRVPSYVGVSDYPSGNVADMKNTGIDLELGWRKKIGDFIVSANGNLSTVKNTVTYVNADTNFIPGDAGFQSMGAVTRTQVGQSYNSFYGYQTAGIFQNMADVNAYTNKDGGLIQPNAKPGDFRWQDTDGDGKITEKDKVFLGSNLPKVTYGITVTVEYKGVDLTVFGQGASGNKIFQGLRRLDIPNANYQTKALSRWRGEGTSNSYPRLTTDDTNGNFTNMSNFYLEKGDYFRLKLVQLGYTYRNSYFEKVGITKLRVYITAENLATLTKYTGYDPEIGGGVFGIDKGYYPQARSFIIGAQLQF
ncbi:MAG: TonB-dependent receptor [Bacteroidetes bacterium]|nr:TonB-dependent receptor [Bacteroidota bacterium]